VERRGRRLDNSGLYQRGVVRPPKERRQITCRLPPDLIEYAEHEAYLRTARPPYATVTLSDVIRIALAHLRATARTQVDLAPRRQECVVVVSGDSSFCSTCGLRWDTNDYDPPACPN